MQQLYEAFWGLDASHYYDEAWNRAVIERVRRQVFAGDGLRTSVAEMNDEDLVRRSFAQHLCQQLLVRHTWLAWLRGIAALCALPVLLVWYLGRRHFRAERADPEPAPYVAFVYYADHREFVSGLLGTLTVTLSTNSGALAAADAWRLFRIMARYPRALLAPELVLRAVIRAARCTEAIRRYRPTRLVDFSEHSSTSSVVTAYLRALGVRYVNVMHGDRAPVAIYAFATFDEMHVWGPYYQRLFRDLHVSADQFLVSGNPVHRRLRVQRALTLPSAAGRRLLVFYEYLIQSAPYLDLLLKLFDQVDHAWEIVLRLRPPRRREPPVTERLVQRVRDWWATEGGDRRLAIEYADSVDIVHSITSAGAAVGIYTTALMDAWVAGRKLICLRSQRHPFKVPNAPYFRSKNVLVFGEATQLGQFLDAPPRWDQDEEDLLDEVSAAGR